MDALLHIFFTLWAVPWLGSESAVANRSSEGAIVCLYNRRVYIVLAVVAAAFLLLGTIGFVRMPRKDAFRLFAMMAAIAAMMLAIMAYLRTYRLTIDDEAIEIRRFIVLRTRIELHRITNAEIGGHGSVIQITIAGETVLNLSRFLCGIDCLFDKLEAVPVGVKE